MSTNVGGIDRVVRIAAGAVLIGLAATGTVGAVGLDRRCTPRHGSDRVVPGLPAVWLVYLQDTVISPPPQ